MSKKTLLKKVLVVFLCLIIIICMLPILSGCQQKIDIFYEVDGATFLNNPTTLNKGASHKLKAPLRLGYSFLGWYSQKTGGEEITILSNITEPVKLYARWEIDNQELPIVSITLNGTSLEDVQKENYVSATVSISNSDSYSLENISAELKGRGHGSWTYPKKGYRIKFSKKQGLFGEDTSKHWVLVANYNDPALSRNNVAYALGKNVLTNIEWTTSYHNVELYVNDVYQGVYAIYEHIRVDENRINIESDYSSVDTGYLIELDAYMREEGIQENLDYFYVNGIRYPFEVKSPDPDEYENKTDYINQTLFIKNYVQEAIDAINNQNFEKFSQLCDVGSFVDMYILQETMKNTDTGWSSFYMMKKPNGKLYCVAPWDFDLSAGLNRYNNTPSWLFIATEFDEADSFKTSSELYQSLMKIPQFVQTVASRYIEVAPKMKTQINNVINESLSMSNAVAKNFMLWEERYDKSNFSPETADKSKYTIDCNFLKNWLTERIEWLTNYFNAVKN